MANNIYPDLSNTREDIPYAQALAFISPIRGIETRAIETGSGSTPLPPISDPVSDKNVDGGTWDTIYTPLQRVNGGTF